MIPKIEYKKGKWYIDGQTANYFSDIFPCQIDIHPTIRTVVICERYHMLYIGISTTNTQLLPKVKYNEFGSMVENIEIIKRIIECEGNV